MRRRFGFRADFVVGSILMLRYLPLDCSIRVDGSSYIIVAFHPWTTLCAARASLLT